MTYLHHAQDIKAVCSRLLLVVQMRLPTYSSKMNDVLTCVARAFTLACMTPSERCCAHASVCYLTPITRVLRADRAENLARSYFPSFVQFFFFFKQKTAYEI